MKTYLQWSDFGHSLDILFTYEREGADPIVVQPVLFERKVTPAEGLWKPTFSLNGRDARDFLKAIVEFADQNQIKPDSNAKLEGKLQATQYHLEDLRHLLKIPKT